MQYANELYRDAWHYISGLDRSGWLMVLGVVMVLGFMCMKGFGSRSNY